jgi:hypothetical protein
MSIARADTMHLQSLFKRSNTPAIQRTLRAVAVLIGLGSSTSPAHAGQSAAYTFTTLLDSARDRVSATRCAAINNSGRVAVQVENTALGISWLVTRQGADDPRW